MNKVSVIIPTKNRIEDIKKCLKSISAQTRLPDELVVVDSSDTEELKSWLDSFCRSRFLVPLNLNFKYIHAKVCLTKARNKGLDNSTKDIVIYVDDDVTLNKNCIKEIVRVFDNDLEKRVGIVFCQEIKSVSKKDPIIINKILHGIGHIFANLFMLGGFSDKGEFKASGNYTIIRDNSRGNKIIKTDTPTADIYALRRETCDKFRWDEKLPGGFYGDDIDLAYRVSRKYQSIYNPRAKMIHKPSRGMSNKYIRAKMRMEFQYYFFMKNIPQSLKYKFAFWFSILGLILISAIRVILRKESSIFRGHLRGFINIIRGRVYSGS